MLRDANGTACQALRHLFGSTTVTVQYCDGSQAVLTLSSVTADGGEAAKQAALQQVTVSA